MQKRTSWVGFDVKMAFQVVELTMDANNNVIDRKVIPYR
jgi:hypothetical protein